MTIKYQGLNITQPIQGEIQAEAFSVDLLNASTTQGSLSLEKQAAQLQFETEREEILEKMLSEQDATVKAELQAQLDELDAKERERHNQSVSDQIVEQHMQKREADFSKVKMGAGLVLALQMIRSGFYLRQCYRHTRYQHALECITLKNIQETGRSVCCRCLIRKGKQQLR